MITAEEKRSQMSAEYYANLLRNQLDQIIRETDPSMLGVKFVVRTPRDVNKEVTEILVNDLHEAGYEAEAMEDKDYFGLVIYLHWGKGL